MTIKTESIEDVKAHRLELWGVLNAVRVAVRFNNPSLNSDLAGLLPRMDEVLSREFKDEGNARRTISR